MAHTSWQPNYCYDDIWTRCTQVPTHLYLHFTMFSSYMYSLWHHYLMYVVPNGYYVRYHTVTSLSVGWTCCTMYKCHIGGSSHFTHYCCLCVLVWSQWCLYCSRWCHVHCHGLLTAQVYSGSPLPHWDILGTQWAEGWWETRTNWQPTHPTTQPAEQLSIVMLFMLFLVL